MLRGFWRAVTLFAAVAVAAGAQAPTPQPGAARITEAELRAYLNESLLLPASQQHIQDGLDKMRGTLPPWFPDTVWVDVKHDVAAVDLVNLLLPLYQRYFSERDGRALVLVFEGPTGHAYAEAALKARLDAMRGGLEGSAAERAAMNSEEEQKATTLRKQRVSELTPEQLASLRDLGATQQHNLEQGLRLDDEQNVVIQKKLNEVMHATLAAHDTELQKAQRAYGAKH